MKKRKIAIIFSIFDWIMALFFIISPIAAEQINPSQDNYITLIRVVTCLFGIFLVHDLIIKSKLGDIEEKIEKILNKQEGIK
jgi:hypothetical protein